MSESSAAGAGAAAGAKRSRRAEAPEQAMARYDEAAAHHAGRLARRCLLGLRRCAALAAWDRRKRAERKLLPARDAEAQAGATTAMKWRQPEWRHIMRLRGVLRPQQSRARTRRDIADKQRDVAVRRRYEARREAGWTTDARCVAV